MIGSIHALASDSAEWQKIPFENRDSIISGACQATFSKVQDYNKVEKNPKRRIETLDKVSVALKELASRVSGVRSWFQRMLSYVGLGLSKSEKLLWAQINHIEVCKHGQTSSFLSRILQAFWRAIFKPSFVREKSAVINETSAVRWLFADDFKSDEHRFQRCAYRTVKNLSSEEAALLDPKILRGVPDYKSVGEDLEQFLQGYGEQLQPEQVQEIERLLQQLKAGQEIFLEQKEIWWDIGSPANQEIREPKIADLAYRIEQQIESLAVGESCLIPGGHYSHFVVFEVQRTSERDFQFAIYNTGEGLHLGLSDAEISRLDRDFLVKPLAIQNLTKGAVSDQKFLMDILRPCIDFGSEIDSMEKIFSVITKHLVDEHCGKCARLNPHEYQSWGTSSFDSIRSYLKTKLEPKLFSQFETHMMQNAYKTVHSLLPGMYKLGAFEERTLKLIEKNAQSAPACASIRRNASLGWREIGASSLDRIVISGNKESDAKAFDRSEQIFWRAVHRTMRGTFTRKEEDLLDSEKAGVDPTYKSVGKDLEQFLQECGEKLQPEQVESASKLLRQIKAGEKIFVEQRDIRIRIDFSDGKEIAMNRIGSLAYQIEQQIDCLAVGESCLIPGGYKAKDGHAVVFEVQRTSEYDFQFAIYNTGEGLYLGLSRDEEDKLDRDSLGAPLAIQNLTKEAVSNRNFLVNILRPRIDWNPETNSMKKLFSIVTKHLVDEHQGTCTRLKPHEIQTWGSCTFDSVRSYLQTKMEPELFAQFETHMMQRAYDPLHRLLPEMRESGVYSKETLDLIEKRAQSAPVCRKPQPDSGFGLRGVIRSMWRW